MKIHDFLVAFLMDEDTNNETWVDVSEAETLAKKGAFKEKASKEYNSIFSKEAVAQLNKAYQVQSLSISLLLE